MDYVDSTKAIDMSLDEIIRYNDPRIAYDAHAEYFLCNHNQQTQGHGESEPSKCKKRRRLCTKFRQKNSRFFEEDESQDFEDGEFSQPPPKAENAQVLPVKNRLGRPRFYQKNQHQSCSNQGQGRNRYFRKNQQEGLTVQISNRGPSQLNQKREVTAVMSLEITAHSN